MRPRILLLIPFETVRLVGGDIHEAGATGRLFLRCSRCVLFTCMKQAVQAIEMHKADGICLVDKRSKVVQGVEVNEAGGTRLLPGCCRGSDKHHRPPGAVCWQVYPRDSTCHVIRIGKLALLTYHYSPTVRRLVLGRHHNLSYKDHHGYIHFVFHLRPSHTHLCCIGCFHFGSQMCASWNIC